LDLAREKWAFEKGERTRVREGAICDPPERGIKNAKVVVIVVVEDKSSIVRSGPIQYSLISFG